MLFQRRKKDLPKVKGEEKDWKVELISNLGKQLVGLLVGKVY